MNRNPFSWLILLLFFRNKCMPCIFEIHYSFQLFIFIYSFESIFKVSSHKIRITIVFYALFHRNNWLIIFLRLRTIYFFFFFSGLLLISLSSSLFIIIFILFCLYEKLNDKNGSLLFVLSNFVEIINIKLFYGIITCLTKDE